MSHAYLNAKPAVECNIRFQEVFGIEMQSLSDSA